MWMIVVVYSQGILATLQSQKISNLKHLNQIKKYQLIPAVQYIEPYKQLHQKLN